MGGSVCIVVAQHMYAMPPYPVFAIDIHQIGSPSHGSVASDRWWALTRHRHGSRLRPAKHIDNVLDRVLKARDAIIHLNWVSIWPGPQLRPVHPQRHHACSGRPRGMFSDSAISIQPIFAQWIQTCSAAAGSTAPSPRGVSEVFNGSVVAVGGKVAAPMPLGTADFMVHHIHAFTIRDGADPAEGCSVCP